MVLIQSFRALNSNQPSSEWFCMMLVLLFCIRLHSHQFCFFVCPSFQIFFDPLLDWISEFPRDSVSKRVLMQNISYDQVVHENEPVRGTHACMNGFAQTHFTTVAKGNLEMAYLQPKASGI